MTTSLTSFLDECPRAVDFVDALPRNATGKVPKRTLREPFRVGHTRSI